MIDFSNAKYLKLRQVDADRFADTVEKMLIEQEHVVAAFQSIRDFVLFTNKRIIPVNIQGVTGTKKDYTFLPYKRIQAFSVETAGVIDLDCELELWFSGLGRVKLEFMRGTDIAAICRCIGEEMM